MDLSSYQGLVNGFDGSGDGCDGLGRLDLSNDNDIHGDFFGAHFWFWLVFRETNV